MMTPHTDFVETARVYCDLIDHLDGADTVWLEQLAKLLPRLHAAVAEMDQSKGGAEICVSEQNLDDRFELFSRLHRLLGERDPYWLEFDASSGGQLMTGSLADDLTDIFCELKVGLEMLENHPEKKSRALNRLCSSYKIHWGQHLMDAQRHLYELGARNQLHF